MKFVATFHSHYDAMMFFQFCKEREITAKLAPTPRRLSASCGTCVVFDTQPEIDYNDYDVGSVYFDENDTYVKIWHSGE
ncbi:MAG: DUF3343 domain-containing protein [Defluviitaleaceae bacterium]|nr:DUF3343 domain-containing protein [Defluviitaleaceae bacterium]